jgi:hypothetical protein
MATSGEGLTSLETTHDPGEIELDDFEDESDGAGESDFFVLPPGSTAKKPRTNS